MHQEGRRRTEGTDISHAHFAHSLLHQALHILSPIILTTPSSMSIPVLQLLKLKLKEVKQIIQVI